MIAGGIGADGIKQEFGRITIIGAALRARVVSDKFSFS
jgi:hypothetical protein